MAVIRGGSDSVRQCEEEARVVGFAMRDDDWEVTRLASLQPIRAEQISLLLVFVLLLIATESHRWVLRNRPPSDSDARRVTSRLGSRVWCSRERCVVAWGGNACVGCMVVCHCCSTSERFPLHSVCYYSLFLFLSQLKQGFPLIPFVIYPITHFSTPLVLVEKFTPMRNRGRGSPANGAA